MLYSACLGSVDVVGESKMSDVSDAAGCRFLEFPVVVPDHVYEPLFGVVLVHHHAVLWLLMANKFSRGVWHGV